MSWFINKCVPQIILLSKLQERQVCKNANKVFIFLHLKLSEVENRTIMSTVRG